MKQKQSANKCNVTNCEYNDSNMNCSYCGSYYTLNDVECMSFIDRDEGLIYAEEQECKYIYD